MSNKSGRSALWSNEDRELVLREIEKGPPLASFNDFVDHVNGLRDGKEPLSTGGVIYVLNSYRKSGLLRDDAAKRVQDYYTKYHRIYRDDKRKRTSTPPVAAPSKTVRRPPQWKRPEGYEWMSGLEIARQMRFFNASYFSALARECRVTIHSDYTRPLYFNVREIIDAVRKKGEAHQAPFREERESRINAFEAWWKTHRSVDQKPAPKPTPREIPKLMPIVEKNEMQVINLTEKDEIMSLVRSGVLSTSDALLLLKGVKS